jgi:hypothetical protein
MYTKLGVCKSAFQHLPIGVQVLCEIRPLGPIGPGIDMTADVLRVAKDRLYEAQQYYNQYGNSGSNWALNRLREAQVHYDAAQEAFNKTKSSTVTVLVGTNPTT